MAQSPRTVSVIKEEDEDDGPEPLWEEIIPQNNEDEDGIDVMEDGTKETFIQGFHKLGKQYIPGRGFSRYDSSLKNLILIRRRKKKKDVIGIEDAGLLSFATFSWLSAYIYKAYDKPLTLDDIPVGSPNDSSEYNVQRLEMMWQDELTKKGLQSASLGCVAWRFIRTRILVAAFLYILYIVLSFISIAFCMRGLLEYVEAEEESFLVGLQWVVLLTLFEFLRVTCYSTVWGINYRTALRLRSACLAMLYRKILRLNSLGNKPVGAYINLFSADGQRIFDFVLFGPMVIGGPISLAFCLAYTYWQLSAWAVLGMCIFFLFYPVQYGLSRLSGYIKRKALTITDGRLSVMTELLQSIKVIKLNAWEFVFSKKIFDIRKKELSLVKRTAYCQSLASSMSSTAPIITSICTFLVHISAGYSLAASQAFPIVSLIVTHMRLSFWYFHLGLSNIFDLLITCNRLQEVLLLNETNIFYTRSLDKSQAVSIANANFARPSQHKIEDEKERKTQTKKQPTGKSWEHGSLILSPIPTSELLKDVLFNIKFYAPKGKLIGICGQVGSGKSTLLRAMMGQIPMTRGTICKNGLFAYVSQEPWLFNATLKDNVLFGEQFVAKRYLGAIYCSCLNEDINLLPGGDDTEIGERGINLSGGQKQRVALARALYADRDIYLLDDPLSAVDAQVRNEIFNKYIKGALKQKTILLVTHHLKFLKECDEIVVMKDGRIVQRDTYERLMVEEGEFKVLIGSCLDFESNNMELNSESVDTHSTESDMSLLNGIKLLTKQDGAGLTTQGILIQNEKVLSGSVRFQTILSYIKASGGLIVSALVLIMMLIHVGSTAFSSWWLAMWLKAGSGNTSIEINNVTEISTNIADNPEFDIYFVVYAGSIIVILMTNLLRGFFFTEVTIKASSKIHKNLFTKLLKSPLLFFETTPIGRIQNLFAKDIEEIQTYLPVSLESLVCGIWQIAFAVFFICLVFPYFVLPLIFLAVFYYFLSRIFRAGIRDLKRMENLSRSPVFSIISATVQGLSTIHAFGKEKDFIRKFTNTFDQNATCLFLYSVGTRWLALRLDALAVLLVAITGVFMIIFHGVVSPSMAGLAIAYAATISGIFQYTVRLHSECESRFLSVERINMYINSFDQEGGHGPRGIPPNSWPELGTIRFSHVYLRYRSDLPYVLNDVSFKVRPSEKIGIIGRTGAGKSSLISALFRLVDITQGTIKLDDLDISTLDVNILRNRLTIIPQEPVLFSTSIRKNLDPGEKFSDEEIWSALERTQLKDKVSTLDGKLHMKICSNGDNFSSGEKQLFCLARALLKKSKIIVLDEATSGIDPETENIIQNTILEYFKLCTVLTIAHRLKTVMSCDRILVMENGQIVECDEPSSLAQNENSVFFKMMSASNGKMLTTDVS